MVLIHTLDFAARGQSTGCCVRVEAEGRLLVSGSIISWKNLQQLSGYRDTNKRRSHTVQKDWKLNGAFQMANLFLLESFVFVGFYIII